MQTISPPLSAESADNYYAEDYQAASSFSDALKKVAASKTGSDESANTIGSAFDKKVPGEWHGELIFELDLQQTVTRKEFRKLAEGRHPLTGEQLIRHVKPREKTDKFGNVKITSEHRAGWDLTFSAPKSISLAALIGGDWRIIQAHRDAVNKSLKETAKFLEARLGNTTPSVRTGKSAFAVFLHDMARPDNKNGYAAPDLHSHAFLFNLTRTEDGKYRSIQPYEMFASQKFATAIYWSELAKNLKKLGYKIRIDEKTGAPEIHGISRGYIEASSPRQREIKETAKNLGIENTKKVAHLNRPKKNFNRQAMRARQMEIETMFGNQAQRVVQNARLNQNQILPKSISERASIVSQAVDFAIREAVANPLQSNWRTIVTTSLKMEMGEITFDEVKTEIEFCRERGQLKDFDLEKRVTRKLAKKKVDLTGNNSAASIPDEIIITESLTVNDSIQKTNLESTGKSYKETIKNEVINEHNEITRRTSARVGATEENGAADSADTSQKFHEPNEGAGNSDAGKSSGVKSESRETEFSSGGNGDKSAGIASSEYNTENKRNTHELQQLETEPITGRNSKSFTGADTQRTGVENDSTEQIGKFTDRQTSTITSKQYVGTNQFSATDQPNAVGASNTDHQFGGASSYRKPELRNGKQFDDDCANIERGGSTIVRSENITSHGDGVIETGKSGVEERDRTLSGRKRTSGRVAENLSGTFGSGCADERQDLQYAQTTQSESTAHIRRAAEFKVGEPGDFRVSEKVIEISFSAPEKSSAAKLGEPGTAKTRSIETGGADQTVAAGTADKPVESAIVPAKHSRGNQQSDAPFSTDRGGNTENSNRELFSRIDDQALSTSQDRSGVKSHSSELLQGNDEQQKSDDFGIERRDVPLSGEHFPISLDTGDSIGDSNGSGTKTAEDSHLGEERAENIENEAFLNQKSELPINHAGTARVFLVNDDDGISADPVRTLYIKHRFDQQLPEQQLPTIDNTDSFLRNNDQNIRVLELGDSKELASTSGDEGRSETKKESERPRAWSFVYAAGDTEHLAAEESLDIADKQLAMDDSASDNAAGIDLLPNSEQADYSINKIQEHTKRSILNSYLRELGLPLENEEEESGIINLTKSGSGTYVSEDAADLSEVDQENRTFTDFAGNQVESVRSIEEQFSQIDFQSVEILQQSFIAAEQPGIEQIRITVGNQQKEHQQQLAQMQKLGSLLEVMRDQEAITAQTNASFQQTGRNFTLVNPSEVREAKERELWQKDREQREAQIAREKTQMRNLMTEDERAAYDQSELEAAEIHELNDDEMSRGSVMT